MKQLWFIQHLTGTDATKCFTIKDKRKVSIVFTNLRSKGWRFQGFRFSTLKIQFSLVLILEKGTHRSVSNDPRRPPGGSRFLMLVQLSDHAELEKQLQEFTLIVMLSRWNKQCVHSVADAWCFSSSVTSGWYNDQVESRWGPHRLNSLEFKFCR